MSAAGGSRSHGGAVVASRLVVYSATAPMSASLVAK